jgi:hypothetical protein
MIGRKEPARTPFVAQRNLRRSGRAGVTEVQRCSYELDLLSLAVLASQPANSMPANLPAAAAPATEAAA